MPKRKAAAPGLTHLRITLSDDFYVGPGRADLLELIAETGSITEAAKRARLDIIINFEHLRDATPEALRALADSQLWQAVVPYAKIHYRKFKAAFEASLEGLSINSLYEDDSQFGSQGRVVN